MVVFFGLCALNAIVRIEKLGVNPRRLIALFTNILAVMLTHYVGIPVAIALGAYLLICLRGKMRWQSAGAVLAAGIVYAAIWGPFMPPQRHTAASVESDFLIEGDWSPFYAIQKVASLPIALLGPPVEKNIASTWLIGDHLSAAVATVSAKSFFAVMAVLAYRGSGIVCSARSDSSHAPFVLHTRYILMCGPGFYLIFAGLLADSPRHGCGMFYRLRQCCFAC